MISHDDITIDLKSEIESLKNDKVENDKTLTVDVIATKNGEDMQKVNDEIKKLKVGAAKYESEKIKFTKELEFSKSYLTKMIESECASNEKKIKYHIEKELHQEKCERLAQVRDIIRSDNDQFQIKFLQRKVDSIERDLTNIKKDTDISNGKRKNNWKILPTSSKKFAPNHQTDCDAASKPYLYFCDEFDLNQSETSSPEKSP